jgi:hypothetical protein
MFEASSDSDLRRVLAESDITVPQRTKGRRKDHTEKYAMAHLLSTLMGAGIAKYPVRLIHRDRPDFLLYMGEQRIGIEHVEAISENEARRKVLRERGHGPEVHFISHKKPGEPKKKTKKLIEEIEKNIAGDGWEGDSVETEWADAMFYFYKKKIDTVKKEGFERFDEDWLLIYDNWNLPAPDRDGAAQIFHELITYTGGLQEFKRILIMTGQVFCEVSNREMRLYAMNDLWKQDGHSL